MSWSPSGLLATISRQGRSSRYVKQLLLTWVSDETMRIAVNVP